VHGATVVPRRSRRYFANAPEQAVVEAPDGPGTPNIPRVHARHDDRANVLWFDGHVSGETLTYVGTTYAPLETYKQYKLGQLVRGDMASLDASYYFFFDKSGRSLF
jgi:prepilin-type processing-associated H-X9-DG protein